MSDRLLFLFFTHLALCVTIAFGGDTIYSQRWTTSMAPSSHVTLRIPPFITARGITLLAFNCVEAECNTEVPNIIAVETRTGAQLWDLALPGQQPLSWIRMKGDANTDSLPVALLLSASGVLHAVQVTSGELAWKTIVSATTINTIQSAWSIATNQYVILVVNQVTLVRVDVADGTVVWSVPLSPSDGAGAGVLWNYPVISKMSNGTSLVCVCSSPSSTITTYHAESGSVGGIVLPLKSGIGCSSAPTTHPLLPILYVPTKTGNVMAFNVVDGTTVWTYSAPSTAALTSPVTILNNTPTALVVTTSAYGVYAISISTGKKVWSIAADLGSSATPSTEVRGGTLIVTSYGRSTMYALKVGDGTAIWKYYNVLSRGIWSTVISNTTVFAVLNKDDVNSALFGINLQTGVSAEEVNFVDMVVSTPIQYSAESDTVLVVVNNQNLTAYGLQMTTPYPTSATTSTPSPPTITTPPSTTTNTNTPSITPSPTPAPTYPPSRLPTQFTFGLVVLGITADEVDKQYTQVRIALAMNCNAQDVNLRMVSQQADEGTTTFAVTVTPSVDLRVYGVYSLEDVMKVFTTDERFLSDIGFVRLVELVSPTPSPTIPTVIPTRIRNLTLAPRATPTPTMTPTPSPPTESPTPPEPTLHPISNIPTTIGSAGANGKSMLSSNDASSWIIVVSIASVSLLVCVVGVVVMRIAYIRAQARRQRDDEEDVDQELDAFTGIPSADAQGHNSQHRDRCPSFSTTFPNQSLLHTTNSANNTQSMLYPKLVSTATASTRSSSQMTNMSLRSSDWGGRSTSTTNPGSPTGTIPSRQHRSSRLVKLELHFTIHAGRFLIPPDMAEIPTQYNIVVVQEERSGSAQPIQTVLLETSFRNATVEQDRTTGEMYHVVQWQADCTVASSLKGSIEFDSTLRSPITFLLRVGKLNLLTHRQDDLLEEILTFTKFYVTPRKGALPLGDHAKVLIEVATVPCDPPSDNTSLLLQAGSSKRVNHPGLAFVAMVTFPTTLGQAIPGTIPGFEYVSFRDALARRHR
eukprot:PhF_6_TR40490/c0_g1_i2/m.60562